MTTYTIVWHRLGHTELETSAETALEVLAEFYPNDDDPATPAEILEELDSSVETPAFSMWASQDADVERILSRQREAQVRATNRIRRRR